MVNPVRNNMVEYSKDIPIDYVEICDLQGRIIFKTESKEDIVLRSSLDSGSYLLNFRKGEWRHSIKLIVP